MTGVFISVIVSIIIGLVIQSFYQPPRKKMTKFHDDTGRPTYLDGKKEEVQHIKVSKKNTDIDWLK